MQSPCQPQAHRRTGEDPPSQSCTCSWCIFDGSASGILEGAIRVAEMKAEQRAANNNGIGSPQPTPRPRQKKREDSSTTQCSRVSRCDCRTQSWRPWHGHLQSQPPYPCRTRRRGSDNQRRGGGGRMPTNIRGNNVVPNPYARGSCNRNQSTPLRVRHRGLALVGRLDLHCVRGLRARSRVRGHGTDQPIQLVLITPPVTKCTR